MTSRIEGQSGIQTTGYHVTIGTAEKKTPQKMVFEDLQKLASPRRRYQQEVLTYGKPLITRGMSRTINGQVVHTPTNEPLSTDEINKTLKRKDLDKDTRLLYELELKRQQQGGFLTREQGEQWIDLQNRKAEEHMQKMRDILKNGF